MSTAEQARLYKSPTFTHSEFVKIRIHNRATQSLRISRMRSDPWFDQDSRKAVVAGMRAARSAGYRPPMKPMAYAHLVPVHSTAGATLSSNVS